MLAARGIVPRTTDELVAANQVTADYYNTIAARIGIGVRLQSAGRLYRTRFPSLLPSLGRGIWLNQSSMTGFGLRMAGV